MFIGQIYNVLKDESGAAAIEYGLLASLVAVAAIGAFSSMGSSLNELFHGVSETLEAVIDIIER